MMTIREQTEDALLNMGCSPANKGFGYICDAMELFKDEELKQHTIDLYGKIAALNNTTASRVERAIRHAFSSLVTKGDLKVVEKYLSVINTNNSALLGTLYIRLKQERNALTLLTK